MDLSLRSSPEAVDPSLAPLIFSDILIDQCFQVATVTVLVYDAVITMDKEIKYFWKSPLSTVNIVYFMNRYIGIFGSIALLPWNTPNVDLTLCKWERKIWLYKYQRCAPGKFADWSRVVANWITFILIDYILTIRVLALYSQDKRLSIFLKTLLALESILEFGLFVYVVIDEHIAVGQLAKDVILCGFDNKPAWQLGLVDWIISTIYGVLLMALALYKAAEYWKMSAGFKGSKLVRVIIEDQVIYFSIVVVVSVMNILNFKLYTPNAFLANLLSALGNPAPLSVLGSRMLVNLKEAGEQGLNQGTSYRIGSKSVSDIDFAEPNEPVAGSLAETTSEHAA